MIIWLTGQPGAGKTTLARELIQWARHSAPQLCVSHIDGDSLRSITQNFDYTLEGRKRNIANVHAIARYLDHQTDKALVVISVVAPLRVMRDELRSTNQLVEVYVHTSSVRGREANFSKCYEPPLADFIDMDTTDISPHQGCAIIVNDHRLTNFLTD